MVSSSRQSTSLLGNILFTQIFQICYICLCEKELAMPLQGTFCIKYLRPQPDINFDFKQISMIAMANIRK